MTLTTERLIGASVNILAAAALVFMVVVVRSVRADLETEKAENAKLRGAFSAIVERSKWSCEVDEGQRVICAVKDGALSRLALDYGDQIVSAKGIASPLGKHRRRKERK